jgi:hypothetical protein
VVLKQRERQKNSSFLGIELIGSDEPKFVVFNLYVAANCACGNTTATYKNYALLYRTRGCINGSFVHVSVSYTRDDDAFCPIPYATVDQICGHV